ncbi:hypothetical protein BSF40_22740 [Pseudomonas sp. ACN5]|nr:hypothetical protein BSF40_22740 [Pseudomonas sp. ACN5]
MRSTNPFSRVFYRRCDAQQLTRLSGDPNTLSVCLRRYIQRHHTCKLPRRAAIERFWCRPLYSPPSPPDSPPNLIQCRRQCVLSSRRNIEFLSSFDTFRDRVCPRARGMNDRCIDCCGLVHVKPWSPRWPFLTCKTPTAISCLSRYGLKFRIVVSSGIQSKFNPASWPRIVVSYIDSSIAVSM